MPSPVAPPAPRARRARASAAVKSRLVERGFHVLFQLAGRPEGATLVELSRLAALSRATTLRILRTLAGLDVVTVDTTTHMYALGPSACRIGAAALAQTDLARVGRPLLERLQAQTGETVSLFRRQGDERICIAAVTSEQDLRYSIGVGDRRPLLRGAAGKVMMAYLDADDFDRAVARLPAAERRALAEDCRRIRAAGVAVSHDEVVRGGTAVGVPVFGADGRLTAILAVLGPTARLDRDAVRGVVGHLREAAREIMTRIGGVPPTMPRRNGR